jgi:hypothetical protein
MKKKKQDGDSISTMIRNLRKRAIPVTVGTVRRMPNGKPLSVVCSICDYEPNRSERPPTITRWLTDGVEKGRKPQTETDTYREVHDYIEATFALQVIAKLKDDAVVSTQIGDVVVWPGCDPEKLRTAILVQLGLLGTI